MGGQLGAGGWLGLIRPPARGVIGRSRVDGETLPGDGRHGWANWGRGRPDATTTGGDRFPSRGGECEICLVEAGTDETVARLDGGERGGGGLS